VSIIAFGNCRCWSGRACTVVIQLLCMLTEVEVSRVTLGATVLMTSVKLLLSNTRRREKKTRGRGKTLPLKQSWATGGVLPIHGAQVCLGWVPTGQICQGWVPMTHPNLVSGPAADRRVFRLIRDVLFLGNMFPSHHAAPPGFLDTSLPSIYCWKEDQTWEFPPGYPLGATPLAFHLYVVSQWALGSNPPRKMP